MNYREMSHDDLMEESLIDLSYALLEDGRQTLTYQDIVNELTRILGQSEEELQSRLVQLYTDLNIDGRFLFLGENRWGLREWYPVEQIEEESAPTVKARKKKAKKVVDEEDEEEIEDLDEVEDEIGFDEFDEDDLDDDEDDDDETETVTETVSVDDLSFDDDDTEDEVEEIPDLDEELIDDDEEEDDDEFDDEEDDLK